MLGGTGNDDFELTLCNASFGGMHPGVCMFAMGDGSIKGIKTSVDLPTLNRLAERSDGLPITGLD